MTTYTCATVYLEGQRELRVMGEVGELEHEHRRCTMMCTHHEQAACQAARLAPGGYRWTVWSDCRVVESVGVRRLHVQAIRQGSLPCVLEADILPRW